MCGNGNPCALLVGRENGAATVETAWQFLKKVIVELSHDLAIPQN